MNALLDSICRAGLNRARIHDALANIVDYEGVTGHMVFDPNQKNVAPMYLGTVHNGKITYRVATMEKQTLPEGQLITPQTTPAAALSLREAAAIRSGANSKRLRDSLAPGDDISGMVFQSTGEPRGQ